LSVTTIPALHDSIFPIKISQPDHCPTYAGRVIHNIKPGCTSPVWLTEKLRHCGIRSIDPVVDVTNYVMLELGQPMHAFDLDTLQGGIDIRLARAGEQLELLDGQQVCLDEQTLLIADAQKPLAIAGIMGGKPSSVTSQTCNLFLESAWFDPIKIAGKARHYGLHTDSSHRFERGVDYSLQTTAIERATSLLIEIVGGEPGPVQHITRQEHLPARQPVSLRRTRLDQQLGVILPDEIVIGILTRLGFSPKKEAADWIITAPPWRFDITIEQDLIEEVARVYGYNRLPTRCLHASLEISMSTETKRPLDKLNELMVARGYREVITYSFISRELQELFSSSSASVSLINPIASDMGDMRLSLMPGLVSTLQQNLNRQHTRARLFESGLRFQMIDGKLQQQPTLAGLAYGNLLPEGWSQATRPTDYFDLKGDVEALLTRTGRRPDFRFEAGHHPALHPGQTAIILDEGLPIGFIGTLHPEIQRKLDLPQSAFLFELDRNALARDNKPAFSPVSRFPEVRRDIAVVVDRLVPSQSLVDSIFASGSDTLKNVTIFDVYCGEHIDPHRKSIALGLTFQHASRTLGESEIVEQLEAIVAELAAKHGAQLRN
jgi:phenylalanyl-tRNA synthetase beta chain